LLAGDNGVENKQIIQVTIMIGLNAQKGYNLIQYGSGRHLRTQFETRRNLMRVLAAAGPVNTVVIAQR